MRKGPQHNTASLLHIVLELLTALFESIVIPWLPASVTAILLLLERIEPADDISHHQCHPIYL